MNNPANQIVMLLHEAYDLIKEAHNRCFDNLNTEVPADLELAAELAEIGRSKLSEALEIYRAADNLNDDRFLKLVEKYKRVITSIDSVNRDSSFRVRLVLALDELEDMLYMIY